MLAVAKYAMIKLLCFAYLPSDKIKKGYFPQRGDISFQEDKVFFTKADAYIVGNEMDQYYFDKVLNIKSVVYPELSGCNYGEWSGHFFDEIPPHHLSQWVEDASYSPSNGESRQEVYKRVGKWLDQTSSYKGKVVLILRPEIIKAMVLISVGATYKDENRVDVFPNTWSVISKTKSLKLQVLSSFSLAGDV
ncbi:histidine phosphatase family protein [Swingsia samuiensis]|uniref:histidine phosphatase family protein n=1 Tax=Swingsia samuiensis TaxID=1293412 RepID=UPI0015E88B06|nr:histidine phosphatase family protein [Swingsia samuiensis]